ncbi:hypothetical protein RA178_12305 [Shewanella oncorhynchi]|uniref:Adhesin n=1 Tax=Shewanella oncorhynchi TaxID=2726434 RepID=A0AA50KAA4_9GAMM|nr:hypothetical protein [Shewanella oncorhynchi]WMB71224.1 hypothetical protein RA178_12305 [Shewanella oncorhynchi]
MNKHLLIVRQPVFYCLVGLYLLSPLLQSAVAETIINIGKGSGIVWEGMPFTATNYAITSTSYHPNPILDINSSVAFINPVDLSVLSCVPDNALTTIAGYKVFKIAQGVGIIPRAMVTANYVLNNGVPETLTGTIGLPTTQAKTTSGAVITNPLSGMAWCLAPRMSSSANFYQENSYINATVTGTWVMIADGTQVSQSSISLYDVNFSTGSVANFNWSPIFSRTTTLRVSTLQCNVSTMGTINFGTVAHNTQNNAELSSLSYPVITQCTQDNSEGTVGVDANINLQFRALTGLYEGNITRLALNEGGGYITGEINNVTGSGRCSDGTGVPFNSTQLRVGSITNTQTSQNITNQVTWRLCSGGSSLPIGNVTASAEMLVTFN